LKTETALPSPLLPAISQLKGEHHHRPVANPSSKIATIHLATVTTMPGLPQLA
jgi:hypothetical protein